MSAVLIAAILADILAVTPAPQDANPDGWWMKRHNEKVAAAKAGGSKVVFIGDSITHNWEQWHFGYIQWSHYFSGEPYKALNLGFGADRTENVLWRIENGELDGYEAKAVVLMIGTNNVGHRPDKETPIDTIIGVKRVIDAIRAHQPKAKVILCGILPRGPGQSGEQSKRIARINQTLQKFADGRNIVFCDFGDRLLTPDGRILRDIMPDQLHPAGEGYEIWANAVIPYINWALTADDDALPMASLLPAHVNPEITGDDCNWHQGVPQVRVNRCVNTGREWWWFDRMAEKRREVAESGGNFDLVFLGDSITQNWEGMGDGGNELAALRKKYSVLDLGYGADGVHHLLWRLEMGELDGYAARGIMMMIGTNNGGNERIVPVVAKVLDLIRQKQPKAKVLLCGMLPLGQMPTHGGRKPRAETNLLLQKLAAEKGADWVDFGAKLLDEKGVMPSGGMWNEQDWVHPKAPGYKIWRAEVEPIFGRWFAGGKAKLEKVVEGTIFVPPSESNARQMMKPDPVELYAGPAVPLKGNWKLTPGMARIDGNLLTVEVDEKGLEASKGHAYPSGRLKLDLSDFKGGIEISIRARAENVVGRTNPALGFKFQMPYTDRLSGQPFWAEPRGCVGTFDWKTFTLRADLSTKDVPSAELMLGLQGATGKAIYDLSSLTARPLRGAFPSVTNRGYRQTYTERVKAWPQLRGVMLPPADRICEKDFADLHEWGATLVRFQMGTAPGENAADLNVYRKWVERMAEKLTRDIISWARKYGIKVCVDLHAKPGGRFGSKDTMMFLNQEAADCFVDTWRIFARRAKGNGDVLYGYDLVNEPMQTQAGVTDYFTLQKRAAEAIREIDPETPIVIESNMMDSPEQYPYLPALEMKDVIYQVHMYVPGGYTHQGLGSANSLARPKYPDPERGWDREFLKKALRNVRDFEQRHGARIFVGEFSAMCYAEGTDRYLADCISIFKEYGWDWTYHAFREWEGWSVEHTTKDGIKEPKNYIPSPDNPRKRALLSGLRGE